jgi:hypothetical protein
MQNGYGLASRIVLLVGLLLAVGAPSQGAPVLVEVRSDGILVQSWNSAALGCAAGPPGVEFCTAISNQAAGDFNIRSLNLTLQAMAIANANLAVDNVDSIAASHRLTVDIILSVPGTSGGASGVSGTLGGSITDGITGTDPGDDDARLLAPLGSAVYTALLDNAIFAPGTMRPNPYQLGPTATSAALPPTNYGLPNPPGSAGPPVASTITLRFDFELTKRDQAGLQGSLRVTPEPSTALLLGLGLAALAAAGRRR